MSQATVDNSQARTNGAAPEARARTAYIAAPSYVDTSLIRKVFDKKGV